MATAAVANRIHIPRHHNSAPCVCGSCTCGSHRCPGIYQTIPFEGLTTYHVQYPPKTSEGQRSPYVPANPFIATPASYNHFLSTNQQLFSGKDLRSHQRPNPMRPEGALHRSTLPFAGTTTNRHDYLAHEPSRRASSAPPRRPIESAIGTYQTTNNAMQGPVAAMMRSGVRRPDAAVHPVTLTNSAAPLDGSTTYKDYYPPKKSVYERLFRARHNPTPSMMDDRDFTTTKAQHYPPHKIFVVGQDCPAAPFSRRPASTDGHISIKR